MGNVRDTVKECTNDACGVTCEREENKRGVSGGVKQLVWSQPKREELLRMTTEKKEMGLNLIDTGHRELL